jgi:hypothetical protein
MRHLMARTTMVSLAALALACTPTPTPPNDTGAVPTPDAAASDAGHDAATTPLPDAAVETAPTFRNAIDLADAELARQALRLMGATQAGGSGSCADCHAMTRDNIAHFRTISTAAWTTCFSDLAVTTPAAAQAVVHCLQDDTGHYTTSHAGIFATGGSFEWFRFVFRRAFGDAAWQAEYDAFTNRTQMSPAPYPRFTQAEFDLLTEWFIRGTPNVNDVIPAADGPGECTSYVDGSVATIVANGIASGWSARNASHGLLMYGCAGAATPSDCLSTRPRASTTTYGAHWETAGTHQRVLFDLPYASSYWTRSSPDGRFVANGGGTGSGASFIDLVRGIVIGAQASYDPGFFPDNSGFIFQGGGTALCELSVLTAGMPTHLTLSEPGCSHPGNIGLYQHVGASLDGGDYWAVNSLWSGDPGNGLVDPDVFVDATGDVTLIRMVNTGTTFTGGGSFHVSAPWQGNAVISGSMRMMVTELATAGGDPLGYVLHRIDIARDATGSVTGVTIPEIARYCVPGGKPAFSLDDRWLVTHHRATDADAVELGFTGASDPLFAPFRGVSNVYLIDLRTGHETRITNMQPGQRALFPHFRSDGWIYFLVRDNAGPERIVASDAALVLGH